MAKLQHLLLAYLVFGSFAAQAPECSLYLAESSIPNAGWGVFAGKNFTTGDPLVSFVSTDFEFIRSVPSAHPLMRH